MKFLANIMQTAKGVASCKLRLRDESGVTTVAMAVCIFLSLALVFSGGQLYKLSSASAEIQEVADASALAAEAEVAEFMVAVKLCDAVYLSMSLLSTVCFGIGVVAFCAGPEAWPVAEKLVESADKIHQARDNFATRAVSGLQKLQKVLPFLATANAAGVAQANNKGAMQANYFAVAMLLPAQGTVSGPNVNDGLGDIAAKVQENKDAIKDYASQAEEHAKAANAAKQEAFESDCGKAPAYCMAERAERLAGLSGEDNPIFSSVDAWNFSVALNRAQAYYSARAANAVIEGSNAEQQADSAIRKHYYDYAEAELATGFVNDTGTSFDCYFPKLFHNTNEMKETPLYTQVVYPITSGQEQDDKLTMHAWDGCPNITSISHYGSIAELDNNASAYEKCSLCEFEVSSMGNVAAASTNIANGFEHHYRAVREAAEEYKEARAQADHFAEMARENVQPINDSIKSQVESAGASYMNAHPPGAAGAIAMVVNTHSNPANTGFESLFVGGSATLGTRAAVSGATLLGDSSDSASSVITSLLDGFGENGGAVVGAGRIVLDCWSSLLKAYQNGKQALTNAVQRGLNSVQTNTESGIGNWAGSALQDAIGAAGLAPVNLDALKPVLVNTGHIASKTTGAFSVRYMQIKQHALAASNSSTDLFSSVIDKAREAIDSTGITGRTITVAEIEFPVGDISVPINITLPETITKTADGTVDSILNAVQKAVGSITGVRSWQ